MAICKVDQDASPRGRVTSEVKLLLQEWARLAQRVKASCTALEATRAGSLRCPGVAARVPMVTTLSMIRTVMRSATILMITKNPMIKRTNTTTLRTVNKRAVVVASWTTMLMTMEKEAKMSQRTTITDLKFVGSGRAHEVSYYFKKDGASLKIEIKRIYVL